MSDDEMPRAEKSACGSVFAKVAEAKEFNLAVFVTIVTSQHPRCRMAHLVALDRGSCRRGATDQFGLE